MFLVVFFEISYYFVNYIFFTLGVKSFKTGIYEILYSFCFIQCVNDITAITFQSLCRVFYAKHGKFSFTCFCVLFHCVYSVCLFRSHLPVVYRPAVF